MISKLAKRHICIHICRIIKIEKVRDVTIKNMCRNNVMPNLSINLQCLRKKGEEGK